MTHTPAVHFLLVDDLEENLLALEALLRHDGVTLLKARCGNEALELLLQHDVALALIDVQMPEMDGFELAELMRGSERTRRVPIIFLTAGNPDAQRRFRGYEAGAVDFLYKPIDPHILKSKADVFFELYRQRQEVAQQRDELRIATEENTRLLQESRRYAAALKEADQRKDDFLAMLAHELRNPLAPIGSAVEILRLTGVDQGVGVDAREIIARQVSHMARLIDDLLDVARIARGKVELRPEHCDLIEIVRHTVQDYAGPLSAGGLELKLLLPQEPMPVLGDRTRLAQVVGNLIHNSCKFTPSGGTVTVSVTRDAASRSAVISVHDTGAGLDAAVLTRIFAPFNQAHQALDRGKGGLGLGLALVQGLIQLHGGSVSAESAGPGQGATFSVRVPLALPTLRESEQPAQPPQASAAEVPLKILVVEDNHDAAQSLQKLLLLMGNEARLAFDGQSALQIAREFHPQVVMSDLGLPGEMDGYALAQTLRAEKAINRPYLIALSGYGQDSDVDRSKAAGFNRHLVKPVGLTTIQGVLAEVAKFGSGASQNSH